MGKRLNLETDVTLGGSNASDKKAVSQKAIKSYVDNNAESTANKVTSISSSSTDTQYPSAKCVYDIVGDIETLLAAI